MTSTEKQKSKWVVYYHEGGIVSFEEYDSLPTELDSPVIYAVKNCDPPECRVPVNGIWVIASVGGTQDAT